MYKIAILNTTHFENKGSMGRIEGLISCLEQTIPGCEITILHRYFKQDERNLSQQLISKYNSLEIIEHPWYRESNSSIMTAMSSLIRYIFLKFRRASLKSQLQQYDAIVDLNLIEPDKCTDKVDLEDLVGNLLTLLNISSANITDKPMIVCSATIGPYESNFLRNVAKRVLNEVDLITLREHYSKDYLSHIGVDKPETVLTADLAFLLEPPDMSEIPAILDKIAVSSAGRPLVGIGPTAMMDPSLPREEYIKFMADISEYLINNKDATIVYIAHTYQDRGIAEAVYKEINNKEQAKILPFELSAEETKGVIESCDLFICSRFHALVASTSLGIPTIGIVAYSRNKFHGIIGNMMGQEDYLIDIDSNFEYNAYLTKLKDKINEILKNQGSVSDELKERYKFARKQTLLNGELIKEMIDKGHSVDYEN
jgi:polysaccharide pyruvyl transferase WcaK-like protein